MKKTVEIIFATASPRRVELARKIKYVTPDDETARVLAAHGIERITPVFAPQDVEERTLGSAQATAAANARAKGESAARSTEKPVLAFDTAVGINDVVLGKPDTRERATEMLRMLCGNTHEVVTAVYFRVGKKIIETSETSYVTFGAFDEKTVGEYVDSGAPFDKAGGYNIADAAIRALTVGIRGDFDNIVGMPVCALEKLIEENIIDGENGYSD